MTELVWLQEPQRRTCLANVVGLRGPAFVLDRSIFSPGTSEYRHPQPADRGELWLGGDKRWLRNVRWHRGELLHTLDGAVPPRGAQLRCHLDVARREATEDTHTAMHLVLSALGREVVLTDAARVQGGKHFVLAVRADTFRPEAIAGAIARANEAAARKLEVTLDHAPRDALQSVQEQPFSDGVRHPGPETTLRIVRIGDVSALPCDGTLRSTSAGLGRVVLQAQRPVPEGVILQFQVLGDR